MTIHYQCSKCGRVETDPKARPAKEWTLTIGPESCAECSKKSK